VQVSQQVIDLFLAQYLSEALHIVAAHADDVAYPVIVGWHSAYCQVLALEDSFQAWPFTILGRVGGVAALAILVEDVPPGNLLRVESQLGVTLAALDFASRQRKKTAAQKNGAASESKI
jgi:hypothetical protein